MFACRVFAMFMEGKDNKEVAKYYKKACELGKKKSDPVFQNNTIFNEQLKQICSKSDEFKAQNLKSTQSVTKAVIAEDYKAACDPSGNWVVCAII